MTPRTATDLTARFSEAAADLVFVCGLPLHEAEQWFRWAVINRALLRAQGNQCQAARDLGIHRNTLTRDMADMRAANFHFQDYKASKKPPHRAARANRELRTAKSVPVYRGEQG